MRIAFLQDQQVRYSVPVAVASAALTGTATSGWTETIVTTATRTIIITLTNTTWVASGATFDAQRQAILDGVISAQSESNGWNAKRPTIPVTAVVRTSNTVVTVTVPVIPTYVVSANETLTVTVPTAATLAGYPLVATPTLTIQNTSPSAVVSGTASSGWYESEVVAGGETILLTLAGENWITAGTAFDAQRQAILDGIVSAQSEAAGWNAVRSSIPVTAVVRTSNTLVTITLPALGSYSVSANETLTVTIPSAALSGSGPIVASPALTVTAGGTTLFTETFADSNFASRGWYDLSSTDRVASPAPPGMPGSLRMTWNSGATVPSTGTMRKAFTATDRLYVKYQQSFSANWVGSGQNYHPHLVMCLSDQDGAYESPSDCRLAIYSEVSYASGNRPSMQFQDNQYIDVANLGANVSEARATCGANGQQGYADYWDSYSFPGLSHNWYNARGLRGAVTMSPGDTAWHTIEFEVILNSIVGGIGQTDGICRYWWDNVLVWERTNLIMRTGTRPTLKMNQFLFAPYIGDGSPVTQTTYIADLTVGTERPSGGIPELPSGLTLHAGYPVNPLASSGWGYNNRNGSATYVANSPPELDLLYPSGMAAGNEPSVHYRSPGASRIFLTYECKYSAGFSGHSSQVNKHCFLFGSSSGVIFYTESRFVGAASTCTLDVQFQDASTVPNNSQRLGTNFGSPITVNVGDWNRHSVFWDRTNNTFKGWSNGTLYGTVTGMNTQASGEFQVAATWGGVGGTVPANQHLYIRNLQIWVG